MTLNDYTSRIKELYPSIVVRPAKPSDAASFVKVFNAQYKRKTSETYFNWQFFDTPVESRLFTAWDGEHLIGFYGIKLLTITGERKAGFAVDMLIEEGWRKRGIVYLLEAEVEKFCRDRNAVLIAALPNNFGNAAFKALGWKSIAKIDTLVWSAGKHHTLEPISAPPLTSFVMSDEYLQWRFYQHPHYRYNRIGLDESNFALTKIFKDQQTGGTFTDIVLMRASGSHQRALAAKVVKELAASGATNITAWALPHTSAFGVLSELGFVGMPQERYFCVKLLSPTEDKLLNVSNWDLHECDAEIF